VRLPLFIRFLTEPALMASSSVPDRGVKMRRICPLWIHCSAFFGYTALLDTPLRSNVNHELRWEHPCFRE